jgi:O-antigen/teichoic acid export membrane protein
VFAAAMTLGQVCALARYTILARLLGPTELGLTVTLLLTAQFFDAVTDAGADRFLVQDRDGDQPAVQRMVQLTAVARGSVIALCLVLLGAPLAQFYGQPDLAPALMTLAIAPLVGGFVHLDLRRRQRHHDFRQEAMGNLAAEASSLVATSIVAFILKSHEAILFGLVIRSAVLVLVSHLTAERRYGLGFSREHARRLFQFGFPLMLNGLLLFFGSQSDRLVIGRELGVAELGLYSSVLMLILYPTSTLQRFISGLFLPLVAAERRGERTGALYDLGGFVLLISTLAVVGFVVVAPFAVVLLFGPRFSHSLLVVALVGVLQTSRFIRIWPVTAALGVGRSSIVLGNNIARFIGVPIGVAAAFLVHRLEFIVAGFVAGELIALVVGVVLVNRARGVSLINDFGRIAAYLLICASVVAAAAGVERSLTALWIAAAGLLALTLSYLAVSERRVIVHSIGLVRRATDRQRGA